ncbi:NADPH:quinone reductase [Nocardioides sp. GY 10113]|nr:NADPH:quinone reductase [Nocardioides sp. GY 10113]
MRAVVLDAPGPVEALHLRELPVPRPEPGWVLISVKAFGLNRSELHTRLGLAEGMTYPRVLGIEATGVVASCPGGELAPGQQVVALLGGMGRRFDGGYAEYTCVPVSQVIAFHSDLPWSTLGAVPEMLQTAYGSLTVGLDVRPGQTLLVRGGTSSVGMTATILAKRMGLRVLATTRNPDSVDLLTSVGVDHVLIDDGPLADRVRSLAPGGVDAALDLVGTPTLPDCLRATRVHGVVCMSGMLSNQWTLPDFYPTGDIPSGVRLTGYSGEASDLPAPVLQEFLDAVAAGDVTVPIGRIFQLDEIREAHRLMEENAAGGKIVVLTGRGGTS